MQVSSAEGTLECHSAHWTDRRPSDMIIYIEIDGCCLSTVMQVTCATTALEGSCPLSKTVNCSHSSKQGKAVSLKRISLLRPLLVPLFPVSFIVLPLRQGSGIQSNCFPVALACIMTLHFENIS